MNDETKDIVKGILKSCEKMTTKGAELVSQKVDTSIKQYKRDKQAFEAWQAQQQQHNWTAQYIQTTAPRLADIMAAVLSSILKTNIDPISVFCGFLCLNDNSAFVWDVDVSIGSSVDISTINSAKLIHHLNNALDNIRLRAIADFSAHFNQVWHIDGATEQGQVMRHSYFANNYLKLWQIMVTDVNLKSGMISLTVYLRETLHVGYFASWI